MGRRRIVESRHLITIHHVSFFIVAAVAFATIAVVAAVDAKAPQLSSPRSLTLGDCHRQ